MKNNRELKFRVWNGSEMVHDVTVGKYGVFYVNPENGDGLNPKDSASLTTCTTKYSDTTPVMQYTGLKDKSGKEIYEGDIVKWETHDFDFDNPCGEEKFNITKVSYIVFRSKGFWVEDEGFGYEGEGLWSWKEIEVIGNQFEHPELLKTEAK